MLTKRTTDVKKFVYTLDPALDEVSAKKLHDYCMSRNIDDLEIEKLKEKPTVFCCKPLMRRYANHVFNINAEDMWAIFCTHVVDIRNMEGLEWKDVDGEKALAATDCNWGAIGPEVISEIVKTIIEAASRDGDLIPFTPPGTSFLDRRIRSKHLRAQKKQ